MMMKNGFPSAFGALAIAGLVLSASQSALAETIAHHDGGVVNVYFAPLAQGGTTVRGVVAFENEPGWKSYWRDPGASGIPPQINLMINGQPVKTELHFPVPQWLTDDYGGFIGYLGPTNVPFEAQVDAPLAGEASVNVNLFAGVCREVCIPVTGQLFARLPVAAATMTSMEQMRVNRSFDTLPTAIHSGVSDISAQHAADGAVVVTFTGAPPQTSFAVGKKDDTVVVSFGPPTVLEADNGQTSIRFEPRGRYDPTVAFDLHFVAALAPNGYQITIPAENIR